MANAYPGSDITDDEIIKLARAGYPTIKALWAKLAEDKYEKDVLNDLAATTGIAAARIAGLLAADAKRNAPASKGGFVSRHWIDLSIAVASVVLVSLLFLRHEPVHVAKLAGFARVRVSLKQLPADATRKTPYSATLVASPRVAGEPLLEDVTVVEIEQGQSPAAVVALDPEQVRRLGRLLGSADLYVTQKVH